MICPKCNQNVLILFTSRECGCTQPMSGGWGVGQKLTTSESINDALQDGCKVQLTHPSGVEVVYCVANQRLLRRRQDGTGWLDYGFFANEGPSKIFWSTGAWTFIVEAIP